MAKKRTLEIADTSGLDDSDWLVINGLKRIYEIDGFDAFGAELDRLNRDDPVHHVKALFAFFPDEMREAVKDGLAESGITYEETREAVQKAKRKLESPAGDQ